MRLFRLEVLRAAEEEPGGPEVSFNLHQLQASQTESNMARMGTERGFGLTGQCDKHVCISGQIYSILVIYRCSFLEIYGHILVRLLVGIHINCRPMKSCCKEEEKNFGQVSSFLEGHKI